MTQFCVYTKKERASNKLALFLCYYCTDMSADHIAKLQAKRAEFVAKIEALEKCLADPFVSRSISAGGGSKSLTTQPAEIRKSIAYFRNQVQLIDAALGVADAPGTPATVMVRFDG